MKKKRCEYHGDDACTQTNTLTHDELQNRTLEFLPSSVCHDSTQNKNWFMNLFRQKKFMFFIRWHVKINRQHFDMLSTSTIGPVTETCDVDAASSYNYTTKIVEICSTNLRQTNKIYLLQKKIGNKAKKREKWRWWQWDNCGLFLGNKLPFRLFLNATNPIHIPETWIMPPNKISK